MNQPLENNQYGYNNIQPKKNNALTIAICICAGILAFTLIAGIFFVVAYSLIIDRPDQQEIVNSQQTVAVTESPVVLPTATPAPSVGGNSYYYPTDGTYFVNAFSNSGIYVRAHATKQSSRLLYIAAGDTNVRLRYLGETISYDSTDKRNYVWYMVELPNGTVGYVRSDVVRQW